MTAIAPSAVVTAFSDARDERQAARELAAKLRHPNLGLVVFFCSIDYRLDDLAGLDVILSDRDHRDGFRPVSYTPLTRPTIYPL